MKKENYKTIMKKTFNKTIIALAILVGVTSCSSSRKTVKTNNSMNMLVGTWQYCNEDGVPITNRHNRENIATYKIYSYDNYTVSDVGLKEDVLFRSQIGSYAIDNDQITESVEYTDARWGNIKGNKYIYKFEIENDLLTISNDVKGIKEIWKKVKNIDLVPVN